MPSALPMFCVVVVKLMFPLVYWLKVNEEVTSTSFIYMYLFEAEDKSTEINTLVQTLSGSMLV